MNKFGSHGLLDQFHQVESIYYECDRFKKSKNPFLIQPQPAEYCPAPRVRLGIRKGDL